MVNEDYKILPEFEDDGDGFADSAGAGLHVPTPAADTVHAVERNGAS